MAERDVIIQYFPKLNSDSAFQITSPMDKNYNCIAWAFGLHKDRWMQPFPQGIQLDGVYYWWPDGVKKGLDVNAYIAAFQSKGYEVCDNFELEDKYVKIALYENFVNGQLICSHAARQKLCGTWMSKLGPSHDIEHGDPFVLEGQAYGKVHTCLKIKR
jgi:hypothetical protein